MNRTVFVGDLSYFTNEVHLMQYMSTVGKVASVQILRGSCGESLMHGFVKYENDQGAARAVQKLHNVKFMGRRLIVNSTNTKAPKKPYHMWHKFTLHFTTDVIMDVNEDMLDQICAPFGEIGDAVVRSHVPLNAPEVGIAGYAVVFYTELVAAQQAFECLHKATINHITFTCSFSTQTQPYPSVSRRTNQNQMHLNNTNNHLKANSHKMAQPGSNARIQIHPSLYSSPMDEFLSQGRNMNNSIANNNLDLFSSLNNSNGLFPANNNNMYTNNSNNQFSHINNLSNYSNHNNIVYNNNTNNNNSLFLSTSPLSSARSIGSSTHNDSLSQHSFLQDDSLFAYLSTSNTPSLNTPSVFSNPNHVHHNHSPLLDGWGPKDESFSLFKSTAVNNDLNNSNNLVSESVLPVSLNFMLDSNPSSSKSNHFKQVNSLFPENLNISNVNNTALSNNNTNNNMNCSGSVSSIGSNSIEEEEYFFEPFASNSLNFLVH